MTAEGAVRIAHDARPDAGDTQLPRSRRLRRGWVLEVLGGIGVYMVYGWLREQAAGTSATAIRNAKQIVTAERFLGLYHERAIQQTFLNVDWFIAFWNIWYGTVHFVLPVVALVWLYRRAPARYLLWRNTLLFMLGLALVGFWLYPLMPPRLMPARYDFVDTAADYFNVGQQVQVTFGPDGEPTEATRREFPNLFAAMPSLHVGWSTWVVLALWPMVRRRWARALLVALPGERHLRRDRHREPLAARRGRRLGRARGRLCGRPGRHRGGRRLPSQAADARLPAPGSQRDRGPSLMTPESSDNLPGDEHLRLALEAGRMGTWSWDALTDTVTWDAAMEACYGLEPGGFGRTFEDFLERVHPEDRDATTAEILAAQESGQDLAFEHRVVWPDGSTHWMEARGRSVRDEAGGFVGMIGIGIEVDDRKRLEAMTVEAEALRANADLVHQLEEAERIARIGSWRWDRATGEVVLSAEMRRQLDIEGPLTGADLRRLLEERAHPEDLELVVDAQASTTQQVQPHMFEHRIVVRGETRYLLQRREVLRDDAGEVIAARGTTQDVTGHRRQQEALYATRERLATERRAVDVLHEVLIHPEFPALEGFHVAARYLSAELDADVGGDWYDGFALPDGRMLFGVGDVSGHGIRAARLMAKLRHAARAYATIDPSPALVLTQLDRFLAHFCEPEEFATVLLAFLDPATGEVELVSGGHPAPLLARSRDAEYVKLDIARAIGIALAPIEVATNRITLEPGSALVLYTDGLVERRAAELAALGDGWDCLATLRLAEVGDDADALCDIAIERCLYDISRDDDVCVLALVRSAD